MQPDFSNLSDDQWFDRVAGHGQPALFGLPEEGVQTSTTGRSGEPVLRDGFLFYQFAKKILIAHGQGLNESTTVMDFGCAWGRLIRYWMHKVPASNLYGFEVQQRFLDLARRDVPGPNYYVSNTRPPLPTDSGKFDLIYAYSVFSHLPEGLTNEWVAEFSRVLKPGGLALLTTRPRAHISAAGASAGQTAHSELYAKIIQDREDALAKYDAGKFVFYPAHGGGSLSEQDYGEAIIPKAYAENNWSKHLEVINLFENYSSVYMQPCFVLRKPF